MKKHGILWTVIALGLLAAGNLDAVRNSACHLATLEPDNPDIQALLRQVGAVAP
ncbi:MAG: hypothetical protein WBQ37_00585 [Candidatus Competibacter sp.]